MFDSPEGVNFVIHPTLDFVIELSDCSAFGRCLFLQMDNFYTVTVYEKVRILSPAGSVRRNTA